MGWVGGFGFRGGRCGRFVGGDVGGLWAICGGGANLEMVFCGFAAWLCADARLAISLGLAGYRC